jgi:hypothetical protein
MAQLFVFAGERIALAAAGPFLGEGLRTTASRSFRQMCNVEDRSLLASRWRDAPHGSVRFFQNTLFFL